VLISQELYDNEQKSREFDENAYIIFPSEGTVPQSNYHHPLLPIFNFNEGGNSNGNREKKIKSKSRRKKGIVNDALVAQYLQV